jgi:hypothetical protein
MSDPQAPTPQTTQTPEINVYVGDQSIPCLALDGGAALVLLSEKAVEAAKDGIHIADIIAVRDGKAVRTVSRHYLYQSEFLLAWDDPDVNPVLRVAETINSFGGHCVGYLPDRRVLVVLHDKPLSFPAPPNILVVPSHPNSDCLTPPPDAAL